MELSTPNNNSNRPSMGKTFKDFRKNWKKSSRSNSQSGILDYIKTDVTLASEDQAKKDDKINRKIYDEKTNLHDQIKKMINDSPVKICFDLDSEPVKPPTPNNHTRWRTYQLAMTPQPAWKMIQATTYLMKNNYILGIDFQAHEAITFCQKVAQENNHLNVLEYREDNYRLPEQPTNKFLAMTPSSNCLDEYQNKSSCSIPSSRQSIVLEGYKLDYKEANTQMEENMKSLENVSHDRHKSVYQQHLSRKTENVQPSAPPYYLDTET